MSQMLNHTEATNQMLATRRRAFLAVSLFIAIILIIFGLSEWTKKAVAVEHDGEEMIVHTHENTVEGLLDSLNIEISDHDVVEPSLHTELTTDMKVVYHQADSVVLMVNGEEETVYTTQNTVGDLLDELGFFYRSEDGLEPASESAIEEGLTISYTPAVEVTIAFDGKEENHWSASATVADFLKEANVDIGEDDQIKPGLNEELHDGLNVQLVRVEKVTDVIEESTAYETVREEDNKLNQGVERVVEKGERGKQELHYSVTFEDGEEVGRELIKTEMVAEAQDRLVAVGTKEEEAKQYVSETRTANATVTQTSTNEPEPTTDLEQEETGSQQSIQMSATAYTAGCDGCSGITATGINLNNDPTMKVVAVDPSVIPLGTRVHVEGYGEAIAGDTGGAIKGNKIDLHVPTKNDATSFGRKTVNVTILD